ncbi:hypothetical protein SDC9_206998 [bioreactor metagenome]|uniref:Uncharacterized protein n=1 Tax=bioreactor metagenome TaxID=1076179 RepID=A0A645J7A1_9ZZZZ
MCSKRSAIVTSGIFKACRALFSSSLRARSRSFTASIFASLSLRRSRASCFCSPTDKPFAVRRWSQLSWRRFKRYSARLVNMRYGSWVPMVTRSSMRTPVYASLRLSTKGFSPLSFWDALMPAIKPWHAASSYPLVPLVCPAMKRFSTNLLSKEGKSA